VVEAGRVAFGDRVECSKSETRRRAMKKLRCGDVVTGCAAVVEGKDEAEVLSRAAEHARKDHGVKEITPELAAKVKAAIRTE
jgi:predicted small metal-binding protein